MDKVDGAQQSWRVSRQGEQKCVFIFLYVYGHCIVSDDNCPHQAVVFANIGHM